VTSTLASTPRSRVRRQPKRGSHDRELIHRILDEGLVCHVGFVHEGQPVVIPTAYARSDDELYLHGAVANRMLGALAGGGPACVTVTLLDGLVLARSAFHHSMNYRSVVLFGIAREVTDPDEKARALDALVDHVAPGRVRHARASSPRELAVTRIVAFPISEGSAKLREGGPIDDPEDLAHPAWAGVVPLRLRPGAPIPAGEQGATPAHVWGRSISDDIVHEQRRGDLTATTDRSRLDLDALFAFLSERSYWARNIPRQRLERALRNSLCLGVYAGDQMLGFSRVVTDFATYAYLCDVLVMEEARGRGIGKWMVEMLLGLPELQGLRRWSLGTLDAHGLYEQLGFRRVADPERLMEIYSPY